MITAGNPHHSMLLTQKKEKKSTLIILNSHKQKYVVFESMCYETTINYYLTEEDLLKFSIP